MSLRFLESFDHYTAAADFETKWNTRGGAGNLPVISAGNGRNGTNSMRLTGTGNGTAWVEKVLDNQQIFIVGMGYKQAAFMGSGTIDIISFRDSGTIQCDLKVVSDNTLRVSRSGTTLGTTTFALVNGQYYYIEVKIKFDPTVGTVDVQVNGVNRLALTGQNTRNSANSYANAVTIGNRGVNAQQVATTADYDDVYICDGAGSVNNNFLSDVRVEAIFPNAAGSSAQWTPSAGSNYQCVDENPPNDDTDYVSDSTVNDLDLYAMSNITPTSGTIKGIAVQMRAKKDDAGVRTIAAAIRTNSNNYVGANQNVGTGYQYWTEIWENNPNTSVPFTITEVNAIEAGAKVIA